MKLFLTFILLSVFSNIFSQASTKITNLESSEIPSDAVSALKKIQDPETLINFEYKKTTHEPIKKSTNAIKIVHTTKLLFFEGKIVGTLTTTKSQNGNVFETSITPIELCYMFCCTLKDTNQETCSQDFKKFQQWQKSPGCGSSRTTACQ